ncbi:GTPase required for pre-60S ribosomal subunit nuclear export and maturation [Naganishia friedmannii]|uniref:GTPase required for pre-60S ribosomal subunit nuclear export and maturation n=1 Tax=Naganishia friedmannii TaxID=89922 RepID=A0ACC2VZN7_9TREE|nr:GTPase required for pre-60S ribosomal subunit nuclear export and maturation [Naganishia friedmannii]
MGKGKNHVKPPTASKVGGSNGIKKVKGENFYRDAKSASRVKMLNGGKAVRDKDGKVIQAAAFQTTEKDTEMGRIQADRRWFGNTRVISQTALDHFRTSLAEQRANPYSVLLRRNKLPMGLLEDESKNASGKRAHITEVEPFNDTFGPKAQRKRPRLDIGSMEELSQAATDAQEAKDTADSNAPEIDLNHIVRSLASEPIYAKGTSRRIWGELYKVLDSSDVVIHVLDARDPLGTRCKPVVDYLRKEKAHKQLIYVLNKVDLVPTWVTADKPGFSVMERLGEGRILRSLRVVWIPQELMLGQAGSFELAFIVEAGEARWVKHLSLSAPTIAFHASINNSFGKGSLIQLLRQFSVLHSDKKQISVGLIGYPNVGKSSIINTLKKKKVCTVAPIPGETKVWQYITLMKRIYLIDCPGIVPLSAKDTETDTVLKGVVRVENLATPAEHIPGLLARVRPEYLERTYGLEHREGGWHGEEGASVMLTAIAKKYGKLLKGGEADQESVAKMILNDWIRGKIPYFATPPEKAPQAVDANANAETTQTATTIDEKERALGASLNGRRVKGVDQPISKIVTAGKFMGEDARRYSDMIQDDEPVVEGDGYDKSDAEEEEGEEEEDEDGEDEDEEEEEEEAPMAWDEVFEEGDKMSTRSAKSLGKQPATEEPVNKGKRAAEGELEEERPAKERRMTTNKKKAENYYTTANVKNRNRERKTPKVKVDRRGGAEKGSKRK